MVRRDQNPARYADRRSCVLRGSEIRLLPKEEERREVAPRQLRYQRYADHRVQTYNNTTFELFRPVPASKMQPDWWKKSKVHTVDRGKFQYH